MFGFYDTIGLNFRGTADELKYLHQANAVHEVYNDTSQNKFESLLPDLYKGHTSKDAQNAYRKMANIDSKEQIFHVGDIMTRDVVVIDSKKTIQEAYEIMIDGNFEQIPVISNRGMISNMITKDKILQILANDIASAKESFFRKLETIHAIGVITSDPISDIRRVAQVMVQHRLNAIPIVNQSDDLVGIVSKSDILNAVSNTPPLQIWA